MNIANLVLSVQSQGIGTAAMSLDKMTASAGRAEKASDSLRAGFGKLMAAVGSVTAAIMAGKKFADVVVQYEGLEAQLLTATGSAEKAAVAFDRLKIFATETPYALNQSVEAFIKLVNLGLTPSERALRSYGDTASAMGKDLTTMVQAVANATVGEFEILKQFGIKAQSEGDKIRFMFRGTTTEVANNAAAIEEYMIKLGENNFAGAMTKQMATLGGAFSNLGDAWDQLIYAMAKSGPADGLKSVLADITAELNNLTAAFESGQATKYIESFFTKFSTGAISMREGIGIVRRNLDQLSSDSESTFGQIWNWFKEAFLFMPENVAAVVKGMGASLGYLTVIADRVFDYVKNTVTGYFEYLITSASAAWEAIKKGDPSIFFDKATAARQKYIDSVTGSGLDDLLEDLGSSTDAYNEEISAIMNERDASIQLTEQLKKEGDQRRANYEAANAAKTGTPDPLAGMGVKSSDTGQQFKDLQKSLAGEVGEIKRSYEERRAIIWAEDNATLEQKAQMLIQLDAMEKEANRKRVESVTGNMQMELLQLQTGLDSELNIENASYALRQQNLEAALAKKQLTEAEYTAAKETAAAIHAKKVEQIELASTQKRSAMQMQLLDSMSTVTSGLEGLMKQGSSAQKAAFLASKAIAMAQAIVNTEMAATKALAEGGAYAGPALATALRITGYMSVGIIAAQAIQGISQHEHGGMIPAGRFGLVGETGQPELVRGPAIVTSARTTAGMLGAGSGGGGGNVSVNVINNSGASVDVEESGNGNDKIITVIVNRVKKEISGEIRGGGSEIASSFENTYAIRRSAAAAY